MTDFQRSVPSLVIANAGTESNILRADTHYGDARTLSIVSPGTLDAVNFDIYVTNDPDATVPVWGLFVEEALGAAGQAATFLTLLSFAAFKIVAASAVGAERKFHAGKQVSYNS